LLKYQIITPEQVSFRYTIAGPVARCMAWLIDQLIIWMGYVIIVLLFARLGGHFGMALILLGIFLLDFSYFTLFELRWMGQSPGKRLFQLRVISSRGSKLRFTDVLVRNLMRPVDLLPYAMVVGGITSLVDRWHRRLGDLVADTIVIRNTRQTLPKSLANAKTRVNSFQSDAGLRNRVRTRATRDERDMIMDLALRRDQIDADIREQLFAQAAAHFRSRFDLPQNLDHLSDEQTVVNLALLLQDAKFTA
jgi:uncharacterized RDD family membrane protein YckC